MLRSLAQWLRRSSSPITRKPSRVRLAFEKLETRDVPATFTVTNGNDAGSGSLRDAITQANTNGQVDTINFSGVSVVTLTSAQLPVINESVTIDGGAAGVTVQRSIAVGTPDFRIFQMSFGTTTTLNKLTIQNGNDTSFSGGGGIYTSSGDVTLNNCSLLNNNARFGGGVFSAGNFLVLNNCLVRGNTASDTGGGVWASSQLTITGGAVTLNTAFVQGGGVFKSGSYTITNCAILTNQASFGGGLSLNSGTGSILGCEIADNKALNQGTAAAAGQGAGIWALGNLTITNSTLHGNEADREGGAIFMNGFTFGGGSLTVTNATIAHNTATDGAGIYTVIPPVGNGVIRTTLRNTIVAFNKNSSQTPRELGGAAVESASSFNLIFDAGTAGGLVNGVNGNKVGIDPKIAGTPLLNGSTLSVSTFALAPDSPAIDAGRNLSIPSGVTTDQRGGSFARIVGGAVDIGAFEYVYTSQVVYDSNGNLLLKDISGRNDDFQIAKVGTNVVITNAGAVIRTPVGTLSNAESKLTIPLTTIRGRLTIAGGEGNDRATFATGNADFPVFFGSMRFDGGNGVDTFIATGDVSATLSDTLFLMSASKRILLAAGTVVKPERAILLGGASANIFDARTYTGFAVLSGLAGNDKLLGSNTGKNILIGGAGSDILQGSASNRDILIGGNFSANSSFTVTMPQFGEFIAKWDTVTSSNFFVLVGEMRAGTGLPLSFRFTTTNLPNDSAKDTINGLGKNDWYWSYLPDTTDKSTATIGNEADALN